MLHCLMHDIKRYYNYVLNICRRLTISIKQLGVGGNHIEITYCLVLKDLWIPPVGVFSPELPNIKEAFPVNEGNHLWTKSKLRRLENNGPFCHVRVV